MTHMTRDKMTDSNDKLPEGTFVYFGRFEGVVIELEGKLYVEIIEDNVETGEIQELHSGWKAI